MGLCLSSDELVHGEKKKREGFGGRSLLKRWRKGTQKVAPTGIIVDKVTDISNETCVVVVHPVIQKSSLVSESASLDSPSQSPLKHLNALAHTVTTQGNGNDTGSLTVHVGTDNTMDGNGCTDPSLMIPFLPGQVPAIADPSTSNRIQEKAPSREFTEEEFRASFSTLVGSSASAFPWPSEEDQSGWASIPPTSAGEVQTVVSNPRMFNKPRMSSDQPDSPRTKPVRRRSMPMNNLLLEKSKPVPESTPILSEPTISLRKCRSDPQTAVRIRWAKDVGLSPRLSKLAPSSSPSTFRFKPRTEASGPVTGSSVLTRSSSGVAVQNPHFIPKPILIHPLPAKNVTRNVGNESSRSETERSVNLPGINEFETILKRIMISTTFEKGDWIIKKHEIGREMYFLSRGSVEVLSSSGGEFYERISAGSFFGELGVLFNVPRTASVRAATTCHCWMLTRERLDLLLNRFPQIANRFRVVAEERMQKIMSKKTLKKKSGSAVVAATMKSVKEEPEDG